MRRAILPAVVACAVTHAAANPLDTIHYARPPAHHADDRLTFAGGTTLHLEPVQGTDGAVARVTFVNRANDADEVWRGDLTAGEMGVELEVVVGRGLAPDEVAVTPPDGFIAVPYHLVLPDGETGEVLIYPADALVLN